MLVCGLSREVTLAVLPRLYVEELVLELGRRNIHPAAESNTREDLISLLCDVMIEEYSRGRRASCLNPQKQQHNTTTGGTTKEVSAHKKPTPATASSVDATRSSKGVEKERRPSGHQNGNNLGRQTSSSSSSSESARSGQVQKAALAGEEIGDVIIVEDCELDHTEGIGSNSRQKEVPSTSSVTTVPTIRAQEASQPQASPAQSSKHTVRPPTPVCKSPNTVLSTSVDMSLLTQGSNISSSRGNEQPKESHVPTPQNRNIAKTSASTANSCSNVESTSKPDTSLETFVFINMETNNYAEACPGQSVCTVNEAMSVQEAPGKGAAVPEASMETSNNFAETSTTQQQPTCTVTTSEEARVIWQNLSKKSCTRKNTCGRKAIYRADKRFTCQECGYRAPAFSALKIHHRIHTGEKPFACDLCGFRTAYKATLTQHQMKHNGEKPFMCGVCGYRATQKKNLAKHMETHVHHGQLENYTCKDCGFKTNEKLQLDNHTCKNKEPQHRDTTLG